MEITHQIASLEDELKLLKGEIKSILKEIRGAVLNQDNPFTSASPNIRPNVAPASEPQAAPPPTDVVPIRPAAQEPADSPFPQLVQPVQHIEPQNAAGESAAAVSPVALHNQQPLHDEEPETHTSLLTIASLLAWAEDAIASLGARRFRLMLELAYSAELLSPDVRDVLREVAEIWGAEKEPPGPVSVNECLLHLRQLEAVVQGERVTRLPRRRLRRRQ